MLEKFNKQVNVIPNNSEKIFSFSLGKIVFKDTCQFLMSSLDALTYVLVKTEIAGNDSNIYHDNHRMFNIKFIPYMFCMFIFFLFNINIC